MRLFPLNESSWRSLKAQWKKCAESGGEDFSTYTLGSLAGVDPASPDLGKTGLYGLFNGEEIHAFCQVHRLLTKRFPTPLLRARLVTLSPAYDLGQQDSGAYAHTLVALFSGVIWLSREVLLADHIRFLLRSPSDAQYFAALKLPTPLSPFDKFSIDGGWMTCTLRATRSTTRAAKDTAEAVG